MLHIVQSTEPRQELRQFVWAYGQREVIGGSEEGLQPVTASLKQILDFEFCGSPVIEYHDGRRKAAHTISVVGPHTFPPALIRLGGRVESFAVFFQPSGLWQVFRIPIRLLSIEITTAAMFSAEIPMRSGCEWQSVQRLKSVCGLWTSTCCAKPSASPDAHRS